MKKILMQQKKELSEEEKEAIRTKDFYDCVLPGMVRFFADYVVLGDSWRCVWAVRDWMVETEDLAVLAHIGDKENVTLRLYFRRLTGAEEKKILQRSARKESMNAAKTNMNQQIEALESMKDLIKMQTENRKKRESMIAVSCFVELRAKSLSELKTLQDDVDKEFTHIKAVIDRLTLRQKEGILTASPFGTNLFKQLYENPMPASSAANLYPFNYSGKTDPCGFPIGRDKFGTYILADISMRTSDKTNENVFILGNSGMGKSYLLKLLLINAREGGKRVISLDSEDEQRELAKKLGGIYIDYSAGNYIINPLQPRRYNDQPEDTDAGDRQAFRAKSVLAQHISFLKDLFRVYKNFTQRELDTLEILLEELYGFFGISEKSDFYALPSNVYPVMKDLYDYCILMQKKLQEEKIDETLYDIKTLKDISLAIYSMAMGPESIYFNGHTNVPQDCQVLVFGVKNILMTNQNLKNAVMFNILSYMTHQMLFDGNLIAAIDEFYLYVNERIIVEYVRNFMKRGRKKDSGMYLASQNPEDYLIPGVKEYTKPLFAIPSHSFLFYPGDIESKEYMDTFHVSESEMRLIQLPERGTCLYRSGTDRYLLQISSPEHKIAVIGSGGGR